MSLGLNDLKKKHRSPRTETPTEHHAWAGKSTTARPWSDSNLAASRANRKNPSTEAVMNEDWLSLQVIPLFWLDLEGMPGVAKLQSGLLRIEQKIQNSVVEPVKAFRKFWSGRAG